MRKVSYKRMTGDQKKEICSLYETGEWSCEELGRKYGFSGESIVRMIRKMGISIKRKVSKGIRSKDSAVNEPKIISMYESGKTAKEIASEFGSIITTVSDILKKHGIKVLSVSERRMSKIDIDGIVNDYLSGLKPKDIEKSRGISRLILSSALLARGIVLPKRKMPTKEEELEIVEMYLGGKGLVPILKLTKRDHKTVKAIFDKYGVVARVPHESRTRCFGFVGKYKQYLFRSLIELSFILDSENDHKIECAERKCSMPYIFNGKKHNYYPDFLVDGNKIVEIKPFSFFHDPAVLAKKKAGEDYCAKRGWEYQMTDWPINKDKILDKVLSGEVKILNRKPEEILAWLDKTKRLSEQEIEDFKNLMDKMEKRPRMMPIDRPPNLPINPSK